MNHVFKCIVEIISLRLEFYLILFLNVYQWTVSQHDYDNQ